MPIAKLTDKFKVNGKQLYLPSESGVSVTHDNVTTSTTGRTQDGKMHITWIRTDIRKVSLSYSYLTGKEADYLVGLLQGKTFQFEFYDRGKTYTMSAYCGKTEYSKYSDAVNSSEGGTYKDFKTDIIEM